MKNVAVLFFLSKAMLCLGQQGFENHLVRFKIVTELRNDSLIFQLNLINRSKENIFLPFSNSLHARTWEGKSSKELVELELGYDLKMTTEGSGSLSRIEPGQTVIYKTRLVFKNKKQCSVKFNANFLFSKSKSFDKKRGRYEWLMLDFEPFGPPS
jgi:hypothetical protein